MLLALTFLASNTFVGTLENTEVYFYILFKKFQQFCKDLGYFSKKNEMLIKKSLTNNQIKARTSIKSMGQLTEKHNLIGCENIVNYSSQTNVFTKDKMNVSVFNLKILPSSLIQTKKAIKWPENKCRWNVREIVKKAKENITIVYNINGL
jgi:hypothetical protein